MRVISADDLYEAMNQVGAFEVLKDKRKEMFTSAWGVPIFEAVPLEDYRSMEQTVYKLTQALAEAEPIKMMCNGEHIKCPAHKDYERGYKDGQAEAQIKAKPTKHGRWERKTKALEDCTVYWHECSECGCRPPRQFTNEWETNYCPNCGAKMDDREAQP